MSIRLRLTLLYSLILALTLLVFGIIIYTIQAQNTLNSLKDDLVQSGAAIGGRVLWTYTHPIPTMREEQPPPPRPFEAFSSDVAFQELREREIVRVLGRDGTLVASPGSNAQEALPLSLEGLQAVLDQKNWWQTGLLNDERVLIYNRPLVSDGEVVLILQVARHLTERNRSLASLSTNLFIASLILVVAAFGIGWIFAGAALKPIDRITQTAQEIGNESDFSRRFTRRVDYKGPNDEIGRLSTTFNSMLAKLEKAYQELSEALSLQQAFVADVSHELRTPLTTIRGNLALLNRKSFQAPAIPPEEHEDILEDLEAESDRLIRLVNNLLILARLDTVPGSTMDRITVENSTFNLKNVIEEACEQARNLDPQREILLNGETVDALEVEAIGDRDSIKQVMLILLDNAIKYAHGSIHVTIRKEEKQAVVTVQDEGPGIEEEALEHIFDRFYRGDVPSGVPGFGLGLPIARALLNAQGGTITIESQPGKGSIARVSICA